MFIGSKPISVAHTVLKNQPVFSAQRQPTSIQDFRPGLSVSLKLFANPSDIVYQNVGQQTFPEKVRKEASYRLVGGLLGYANDQQMLQPQSVTTVLSNPTGTGFLPKVLNNVQRSFPKHKTQRFAKLMDKVHQQLIQFVRSLPPQTNQRPEFSVQGNQLFCKTAPFPPSPFPRRQGPPPTIISINPNTP